MTNFKNLSIVILLLTSPPLLSAQDWFPEGAEWAYMYGTPAGPEQFQATLRVTELTEADGKMISKIEVTEDSGFGIMTCQVLSLPLYAYTSNDSLYYATAADSTYRLALLTTAEPGESWYIAGDAGFGPDSNLVEVTGTEQYAVDGGSLNGLICEVTASEQGLFETAPGPSVIAERAGSLNHLLFPLGTVAACDAVAGLALMCYTDETTTFQAPGFDSCILSSQAAEAPPKAVFFPNPASGILFFKAAVPVRHIRIIDRSGRTVKTADTRGVSEGSVDLRTLAGGLYNITLETDVGEIRKKVMVR